MSIYKTREIYASRNSTRSMNIMLSAFKQRSPSVIASKQTIHFQRKQQISTTCRSHSRSTWRRRRRRPRRRRRAWNKGSASGWRWTL